MGPSSGETTVFLWHLVEHVWNVMAHTHTQKPDLVFHRNRRVHLNQRGSQFSRLQTVESADQRAATVLSLASTLIIAWKCRYRAGEKEWWAWNNLYVYKFMKTESGVGITILLPEVQKRVAETCVSRTLCRVLKEGKNVETGITMAFSTPRKLGPRVCTKSILDNFNEALLRIVIHNFYLNEKQQPTPKAIHSKMCESTCYGGGVFSPRLVLRKMGFR